MTSIQFLIEWKKAELITLLFEAVTLVHLFRHQKDLSHSVIGFAILCEFAGNFYGLFPARILYYLREVCRITWVQNSFVIFLDNCIETGLIGIGYSVHIVLLFERFLYICSTTSARIVTHIRTLVYVACGVCVFSQPVCITIACGRAKYYGIVHNWNNEVCAYYKQRMYLDRNVYMRPMLNIARMAYIILLLVFLRYFKRLSVSERRKTIGILIVETLLCSITMLDFLFKIDYLYYFAHVLREMALHGIPVPLLNGYHLCFYWVYVLVIDDVRTAFWTVIRGEKIFKFFEPTIRRVQGIVCPCRAKNTEEAVRDANQLIMSNDTA